MKPFIKKATQDTPGVIFSPDNNLFELTGHSLPEDAKDFYEPVLDWIAEYVKHPNEKTLFEVRLEYFNTSSSKMLLDVFFALDNMAKNGHSVAVHWYYREEDDDMKEAGEEYEEMTELEFKYFPMD